MKREKELVLTILKARIVAITIFAHRLKIRRIVFREPLPVKRERDETGRQKNNIAMREENRGRENQTRLKMKSSKRKRSESIVKRAV